MESYLTVVLLSLLADNMSLDLQLLGISGHSRGGHGAISLVLRYPQLFSSLSAFAPICAPSQCPWGYKAFNTYLGPDESRWREHDSAHLINMETDKRRLLVDQGEADPFLQEQLHLDLLEQACQQAGYPLQLRRHAGYDQSYFFIASFTDDHRGIITPSSPPAPSRRSPCTACHARRPDHPVKTG